LTVKKDNSGQSVNMLNIEGNVKEIKMTKSSKTDNGEKE